MMLKSRNGWKAEIGSRKSMVLSQNEPLTQVAYEEVDANDKSSAEERRKKYGVFSFTRDMFHGDTLRLKKCPPQSILNENSLGGVIYSEGPGTEDVIHSTASDNPQSEALHQNSQEATARTGIASTAACGFAQDSNHARHDSACAIGSHNGDEKEKEISLSASKSQSLVTPRRKKDEYYCERQASRSVSTSVSATSDVKSMILTQITALSRERLDHHVQHLTARLASAIDTRDLNYTEVMDCLSLLLQGALRIDNSNHPSISLGRLLTHPEIRKVSLRVSIPKCVESEKNARSMLVSFHQSSDGSVVSNAGVYVHFILPLLDLSAQRGDGLVEVYVTNDRFVINATINNRNRSKSGSDTSVPLMKTPTPVAFLHNIKYYCRNLLGLGVSWTMACNQDATCRVSASLHVTTRTLPPTSLHTRVVSPSGHQRKISQFHQRRVQKEYEVQVPTSPLKQLKAGDRVVIIVEDQPSMCKLLVRCATQHSGFRLHETIHLLSTPEDIATAHFTLSRLLRTSSDDVQFTVLFDENIYTLSSETLERTAYTGTELRESLLKIPVIQNAQMSGRLSFVAYSTDVVSDTTLACAFQKAKVTPRRLFTQLFVSPYSSFPAASFAS